MFSAKLSVIRWKWSSEEQLKMEKMLIVNKKYFVVEVADILCEHANEEWSFYTALLYAHKCSVLPSKWKCRILCF